MCAVLAAGYHPPASAQLANPESRRGTNYDPPPPPKPVEAPRPPAPDAATPSISIPELDWTDKNTWLKLALLVGSVTLALRAFRQMKDGD
jgi:hypothetical protein